MNLNFLSSQILSAVRMSLLFCGLSFLFMPINGAHADASSETVSLDSVLSQTLTQHPEIGVSRRQRDAAYYFKRARGFGFEPTLALNAQRYPYGYYEKLYGAIEAEQPLWVLGATLQASLDVGEDFPIYQGESVTADSFRWRASLNVPLLRYVNIDDRRLGLWQARAALDGQQALLEQQEISVLAKAAQSYWKASALSALEKVALDNLKLAEQRQRWLQSAVQGGDRPPITLVDNEQFMLGRQAKYLEAKLKAANAKQDLGYYLMNESDASAKQASFAEVVLDTLPQGCVPPPAVQRSAPPWLVYLKAEVRQARLKERYKKTKVFPEIRLKAGVGRQVGESRLYGPETDSNSFETKGETDMWLKLSMKSQLTQSQDRNDYRAEKAGRTSKEAKLQAAIWKNEIAYRNARQTIVTELKNLELQQKAVILATQVAEAERRKWELGASNLLFVNARESRALKAQEELVETLLQMVRASIEADLASGQSPTCR